jgi:hypothetical protein
MIQAMLSKWILKKGSVSALLFIGELIVKTTKSKKDDKMWKEIKRVIKKYK